jgi:hypothetical protein
MGYFEYFNREKHCRIGLLKELLVRMLGKRIGYVDCCKAYEWRGAIYIIK